MRMPAFRRGFDGIDPGEQMRRTHERWLNRALGRPELESVKIPVRRVDQGGFSMLMSAPGGPERAEQWWMEAFAALDALD